MIETPLFRQGDPLWGNKRLANTNLTIGSHGCFMTSVSMMLYQMLKMNPGEFHDACMKVNGFDAEGQIVWDAVERMTGSKAVFIERSYTKIDPRNSGFKMEVATAIEKVRRYLDCGCAVVLCVDAIGNDGWPDHAILAYDYMTQTDGKITDFWIKDPGYGEDVRFSRRYGSLETGLFGYVGFAYFSATFPDRSMDRRLNGALCKAAQMTRGLNIPVYSKEVVHDILSV